ncbi:pyridoxal phosphate-dependent aminotransferase family protein [bacterium]|nr:pyridoxal phosphate-dependent aminotransferase family protein [bacterium]
MLDNIVLQGPVGPEILVNGKKYLYFGGSDYLGMSSREQVMAGARAAIERFGVSSAASRVSSGTNVLHLELESALAAFSAEEEAVIFSSGYLGMNVLLGGVAREGDRVFLQEDAHSSVKEAVVLTGLPCDTFSLSDLEGFRSAVKRPARTGGRLLVVGEGVSPLMGTIFPLPEVLERLEGTEALVLLDDAHAFGALGKNGRGTAEYFGLSGDERLHRCATLSKAFGSFGGCIDGSHQLIEAVRERSMAYVCSTPPPAPILGAALAAVRLAAERPQLLEKLRRNVSYLKDGLRGLGLEADSTPVPIIPVCLEDAARLRKICSGLENDGIVAPLMTYPGSPAHGMIRLAVSSLHAELQIQSLLDSLARHL